MSLEIPAQVRRKLHAAGASGGEWLASLPSVTDRLSSRWGFEVEGVLEGGSEALVLLVRQQTGDEAVVKIGFPDTCDCANEARVLRLGAGHGYVALLAHDDEANALMLERLGPPLASAGKSAAELVRLLAPAMQRGWIRLRGDEGLMTGAQKAAWLRKFIADTAGQLETACEERTLALAMDFCKQREAAHDPAASCLVHGDVHEQNTLYTLDGQDLKFIDPDGIDAEPACDLATLMRDWSSSLLAGDPLALGLARCREISALTDVDEEAIWQWGFMERVSTGLLLLQMGAAREGRQMLAVADAWSLR